MKAIICKMKEMSVCTRHGIHLNKNFNIGKIKEIATNNAVIIMANLVWWEYYGEKNKTIQYTIV